MGGVGFFFFFFSAWFLCYVTFLKQNSPWLGLPRQLSSNPHRPWRNLWGFLASTHPHDQTRYTKQWDLSCNLWQLPIGLFAFKCWQNQGLSLGVAVGPMSCVHRCVWTKTSPLSDLGWWADWELEPGYQVSTIHQIWCFSGSGSSKHLVLQWHVVKMLIRCNIFCSGP